MAKAEDSDIEEVGEVAAKPRAKKGRARVEHTIKTTFVEEPRIKDVLSPAAPFKPSTVETDEPEIADSELVEAPQTIANKVARFLEGVESEDAEYELCVWRLPLYNANGRTDTRSGRAYVGKFPFDPDTYETEIKARYARPGLVNIFHCEIRQKGAPVSSLPVTHIELETETETPYSAIAPTATAAPVTPAAPVASASEAFEQQLQSLERLLSVTTKLSRLNNPAPAAPVVSAAPEISKEAAIISFLMDGEETADKLRNSALGKILGSEAAAKPHEPNALEVVSLIVQSLPVIVQEGVKLWERFRPTVAQPTNTQQPAPALPQPAAPDPMAEYHRLFDSILQQLEANADTQNAGILIRAFLIQHPQFNEPLMDFLQADAPTLLAMLKQIPGKAHLADLPHAPSWLTALHSEFFESEVTP